MNSEESRRFLTAILYLNAPGRGETVFPGLSIRVSPAPGRMVVFQPLCTFPHAGLPPCDRPKYILHRYLWYPPAGRALRLGCSGPDAAPEQRHHPLPAMAGGVAEIPVALFPAGDAGRETFVQPIPAASMAVIARMRPAAMPFPPPRRRNICRGSISWRPSGCWAHLPSPPSGLCAGFAHRNRAGRPDLYVRSWLFPCAPHSC